MVKCHVNIPFTIDAKKIAKRAFFHIRKNYRQNGILIKMFMLQYVQPVNTGNSSCHGYL